MKAEPKEEFLNKLEQRLESQLQRAIKIFQNLDTETLLRPSPNGGWSIAQCLEHLNSYGHFYLPEISKALVRSNEKEFKSGWLGNYFANMMEPGQVKKHKAFKGHQPAAELDAHAVVAEFILQLETLHSYLKDAYSSNLDARVPISISTLVKLKLGDVFRFMIAHNERHIQQAMRNL